MLDATQLAVIILAAGQGTRMKSKLPKVLHKIGGRALIEHVVETAAGLQPQHIIAVVRHEKELVGQAITSFNPGVVLCEQDEIPGTGRAVELALAALPQDFSGDVVVLSGDVPLIDVPTLQQLLRVHTDGNNQMTILSAQFENPTGLGRILRDDSGAVKGIVEEKDATAAQRQITEINGGIYVFNAQSLQKALSGIGTENAQGEKYLTDAASVILAAGGAVAAQKTADIWVIAGVNDRAQLADAATELNARTVRAHQRAGVTILDAASTYIDVSVQIEPDATIEPGTFLRGTTTVAAGAVVGPASTVVDSQIGAAAKVVRSEVHKAQIAAGADIGPFAYLRPGTEVGAQGKVGAYVEIKNSVIGAGSKVPHLSYVGDTAIGTDSNIGAGTIVANYDGVNKHRSTVGDCVRVGSKNVLVSPVSIGDGAYTAAGAVVRKDVPAGALAMSVAAQRNLDGWVATNRPGSNSAKAAATATTTDGDER